MTIYVDMFFFINFAADFVILLTTAVLLGIKIRKLRLAITSAYAAFYSVAAIFFAFLSNTVIACIFSAALIFFLFGKSSKSEFIKRIFVFCIVCIITSGICSFLARTGNLIVVYTDVVFFPADDLVFFIALCAVYMITILLKYYFKKHKLYHKICLRSGSKQVDTTAYYDTGNRLTDPESRLPVIIITKKIADELSSGVSISLEFTTISDYRTLSAIPIDEVYFYDENISVKNVLGGIMLPDDKDFKVLLHSNVHP